MRAELVVRADDAGVAERGGADAGAVSRRRRLRSTWLEELRAKGGMAKPRLSVCSGSDFCPKHEPSVHGLRRISVLASSRYYFFYSKIFLKMVVSLSGYPTHCVQTRGSCEDGLEIKERVPTSVAFDSL